MFSFLVLVTQHCFTSSKLIKGLRLRIFSPLVGRQDNLCKEIFFRVVLPWSMAFMRACSWAKVIPLQIFTSTNFVRAEAKRLGGALLQ